jgi:hypothetical protein
MISFKEILNAYAKFVTHHPVIVLLIVVFISVIAIQQAQNVQTKSMDYKDMLPDNLEVMKAMDLLNDNFGGSDSAMFAIELDSKDKDSTIKDIRDPEVIKYIYLLGEMTLHTDDVVSVTSGATLLKQMNNNHLPKSLNRVKELEKDNVMLKSYLSDDHALALIKIKLSDDYNEDEIIKSLNNILTIVPKPAGVKASIAGNTIAQTVVREQLGSDMSRTSMFSMIGIIIILLLLFRSLKYSFIPLTTIGVGIVWAFGYIGLIGMGMSSATSGVISMIMGIGIDFGIQTVTRFRQELKVAKKKNKVETAMTTTLNNVIVPMATTTLAALIGFKAMSMGQLTMMAEMGTMMSYGIAACFLAAITVVPALLVLFEKIHVKNFTWR